MKTYLYRLCFNAPIHLGTTGIGLEETNTYLSSDSLTSALINSFSILGDADKAIEALTKDSPAFVLSSLFPFGRLRDCKNIAYALPRPLVDPEITDEKILTSQRKDLRQIKYLLPQDFFAWIGEKPMTENEIKEIKDRSSLLAKPWSIQKETGWWITELRPRVALDRVSQNSAIWRCEALRFSEGAGLYGLIHIEDDEWKSKLSAAFGLLGELGIGGERTYGMGTFEFSGFEEPDKQWNFTGKPSNFVLLSRYFPSDTERSVFADIFDSWDFIESRGYIVSGRMATTLKRKHLKMVVEGSVAKSCVKGKLADVTPDKPEELGLIHKVYRSGLAFLLPTGGSK